MDLKTAITATNALHTYVPDRGDEWDVDPTGDCEDYSFAVLWRYADESRWGFIKAILSSRFRFWFVEVGDGPNNGHFVTEDRQTGLMFDNNWKRLVDQSLMERRTDYRFRKAYWKLRILWKVAFT